LNKKPESALKRTAVALGGFLIIGTIAVSITIVFFTRSLVRKSIYLAPPSISEFPESVGIAEYDTVTFDTDDSVKLSAWYVPPRNGTVIILAHGHGGNRTAMLQPAVVMAAAGYGVFMFDFRSHGESGGDYTTIGEIEVLDLEAAVDWVDAQPDVEHIGAVGLSMGGAVVVRVAAEDQRIEAASIESAFPSLRDAIMHRSSQFSPVAQVTALQTMNNLGVDVSGVRPIDDLCDISPRPLLLIYGTADETMPADTPQRMAAAACEPSDLILVEGMRHQQYMTYDADAYSEIITIFFNESLLRSE